jgi:hypothetical protein
VPDALSLEVWKDTSARLPNAVFFMRSFSGLTTTGEPENINNSISSNF